MEMTSYSMLHVLEDDELYYVTIEKRYEPGKGCYLLASEDGEIFGFKDVDTARQLITCYNGFSRIAGRAIWSWLLTSKYAKATREDIEKCVKFPLSLTKIEIRGFACHAVKLESIGESRFRSMANSCTISGV